MVLPIILSLLETSHTPRRLLFHSNGILSFRSDDCRVKLGAVSSTFLSGTLSAIRTNFLQREFHMMGWGRAAGRGDGSKELRERAESIKWHSELRNFSLSRTLLPEFMVHSAFRLDYVQTAGDHPEICPAAILSFFSPYTQPRGILLISSPKVH